MPDRATIDKMRSDGFGDYFDLDSAPEIDEHTVVAEARAHLVANRADYEAQAADYFPVDPAAPGLLPTQRSYAEEFLGVIGIGPRRAHPTSTAFFLYGKAGRGKTYVLNAFAARLCNMTQRRSSAV